MNPIDFGNGVVADEEPSSPVIIIGHSGLEFPTVEIAFIEGSVSDGGTIFSSRSTTRRMTVVLYFGSTKTGEQVAALFSPGVERIISSLRGSMTYYVEGLAFAKTGLLIPVIPSIIMLASKAFPEGSEQTESMTGTATIDSLSDVDAAPRFTITVGSSISGVVITTPGCTTTIIGDMISGDVLVVDSAEHTVTVNDENFLSWFDRTGRWPKLVPGNNDISVVNSASVGLAADVSWRPRVMGL